jgi:hypothetical protein
VSLTLILTRVSGEPWCPTPNGTLESKMSGVTCDAFSISNYAVDLCACSPESPPPSCSSCPVPLPSNSPFCQLKSPPKRVYGTHARTRPCHRPMHRHRHHRLHTSETSTLQDINPRHTSRSSPTPRVRLACTLTGRSPFSCCVGRVTGRT